MKKKDISLKSILTEGHIQTEMRDEVLYMTTERRLSVLFNKENTKLKSYAFLPDMFRLPFRLDMVIKMDAPGFYLFIGQGHINFGTPWLDNRQIEDIVRPKGKPRQFYNHIPLNKDTKISVIYDHKAMQILVDDEERFYSVKEPYMKSKLFKEQKEGGFRIKMTCDKRTKVVIKSIEVTEYDEKADIVHTDNDLPDPVTRNRALEIGEKPTIEKCISLLPSNIQGEIIRTDEFLRTLKPMKFRRQYEKKGNKITYLASKHGFSYAIYPSNDRMHHSLSWYIITSSKPEDWHRKDDKMEATLERLSQSAPETAERMFTNLNECIGCCKCAVKTPYEFKNKKKVACHGIMMLKMSTTDFQDVRKFIEIINELTIEEERNIK